MSLNCHSIAHYKVIFCAISDRRW